MGWCHGCSICILWCIHLWSSLNLYMSHPPKRLHNWVALSLGNCVLLVVGMFLDQKTSFYDYSYLDYGFKVMFIGKGLFILRVWAKIKFCLYDLLKRPTVPFYPLLRKFLWCRTFSFKTGMILSSQNFYDTFCASC